MASLNPPEATERGLRGAQDLLRRSPRLGPNRRNGSSTAPGATEYGQFTARHELAGPSGPQPGMSGARRPVASGSLHESRLPVDVRGIPCVRIRRTNAVTLLHDIPHTQGRRGNDRDPGGGLRIDIARAAPDVAIVSLAGDLDIGTADAAATALADTVAANTGGRVVLDLNHVSFLAAHGLAVILATQDHAHRWGTTLVLVHGQDAPAARTLRFLPAHAPLTYPMLSTALAAALAIPASCEAPV